MSVFVSSMKKKLKGYKMLTKNKEMISFNPDSVSIPLSHRGSKEYQLFVKENDHVKIGQLIGATSEPFYIPFYASVSGIVEGVESIISDTLSKVDHLVIKNDKKYEIIKDLSLIDYQKSSAEELIEFCKKMGIVGLGGAGFPTYIKYQAKNIHTLVINAVECEPYLTSDCHNLVLDDDQGFLQRGIKALIKMANLEKVIYAVKKYEDTNVEEIISYFTSLDPKIEVRFVADRYPNGWERTLIYELFKKRYDKLTSELGIVVNNPSTIIAFGHAMVDGIGITRKMVTVSGDALVNPTVCDVPVGTKVKDIIDHLGGYNNEDIYLVAGGPMMGQVIPNDQWVISLSNNAVSAMKVEQSAPTLECLSCSRCIKNCPAGLQPTSIMKHAKIKDKATLQKLGVLNCIECGLCSYVCPSKIEVTDSVRKAKRLAR
ncbi:MAG: RnfABCDGE type electron transport complex subunit C [Erysipelotrichaceae bacterium]